MHIIYNYYITPAITHYYIHLFHFYFISLLLLLLFYYRYSCKIDCIDWGGIKLRQLIFKFDYYVRDWI